MSVKPSGAGYSRLLARGGGVGTILGVAAALSFGSASFAIAVGARGVGAIIAMLAIEAIGLPLALAVALAGAPPEADAGRWGLVVLTGLVGGSTFLVAVRAYAVGSISVVAPIASTYPLATALLATASGERAPFTALLGAVLIVAGVVVVSRGNTRADRSARGIPEAIAAAALTGLYLWLLSMASPGVGPAWTAVTTRIVSIGVGLLAFAAVRPAIPAVSRKVAAALVVAALLDSSAVLLTNTAVATTYASVAAALVSMHGAVAALLGWLFLKERLGRSQLAALVVMLGGILLVTL